MSLTSHLSSDITISASETASILSRTGELLSTLDATPSSIEILAVSAALRPSRNGGTRVERQEYENGRIIIHNYGAGGIGYQAGIAMANDAVNLAEETLHALLEKAGL